MEGRKQENDLVQPIKNATNMSTQSSNFGNSKSFSILHNTCYSDTSFDDPHEELTQKYDNFKITIRQLQKELQSEKVKNRGLKTVIDSSKETNEENIKLRRDLQNKESAIAVLQNRLGQLGENTNVILCDGEVVIPGPSRQTLDALTEEISKLKDNLRYMAVNPSQVGQLQKAKQAQEKQLKEVTSHLQKYKQETVHLKTLLESSEDVKDNEIIQLRQTIEDLQQNKDSQNILCQSLSDETENLREKLKAIAGQCNEMEKKLGNISFATNDMVSSSVQNKQDISLQQKIPSETEGTMNLQQENQILKRELDQQKKKLDEIIEMNSRWQKYNTQREEYVQKMHRNLRETEERLAKRQGQGISEEQQANIDRIILQCKKKVELVEEDKQKVDDENRLLHLRIHEIEQQTREKDSEINNLRQHVQALANDQSRRNSEGDQERIQILEQQIKICTEDFHQERQDREQAMSRIAQLENEQHYLKSQLQQNQNISMEQMAVRRQESINRYQQQYIQQHPNHYYQHGGMVARGPITFEADGEGDVEEDYGEDVIDSPEILRIPTELENNPSYHNQQQASPVHQSLSPPGKAHSESGLLKHTYADSAVSKPLTVPANLFSSRPNDFNEFGISIDNKNQRNNSPPRQDDMLQCPKCRLAFPSHKHFELLEHINDCC